MISILLRASTPVVLAILALPVLIAAAAADDESPPLLVPGRFGQALDALEARPSALSQEVYAQPPLTVECWALLRGKTGFNVILASHPKASGDHWELYTASGTGAFSVFLPGYDLDIKSDRDVADGLWHHLALVLEPTRARLYVDGQLVADRPIARQAEPARQVGPLTFGTAADDPSLQCDGLIDEVRLSRGVRSISSAPDAPFDADDATVGLWRFDQINNNRGTTEFADESSLRNPAALPHVERLAMDEIDRRAFNPGPSPLESPPQRVELQPGPAPTHHPDAPPVLNLDGLWQMAEGGSEADRLAHQPWPDAIPAAVPGSVHAALTAAGKIPDPKFARNDAIAHDQSFKTWWYQRTFPRPDRTTDETLVFDGVAIHATVWLNGQLLGRHDGMFGGPRFRVAHLLRDHNTLTVKIDPAPGDPALWNNPDWRTTVVFNNVWGWHYSSIPALGLWRSVRIEGAPTVRLAHPFIATRDAHNGTLDLVADLHGPPHGWNGRLLATISPENFDGPPHHFALDLASPQRSQRYHFQFHVPDPHLWWPNDLGRPDLYRLTLSFQPTAPDADADDTGDPESCSPAPVADRYETTFGIRTITMAPLPAGPRADKYNWTFVINGQPTFIKGSGWCTMDSSMDFSRPRYDRVLSLAQLQHVQMLRAWGSGAPETDDFYDLCDRKGLLVLQEWPTAWNSHHDQPYDVLEETVRLNTLRIRNHPSLAMYGAGNESNDPFGPAIDMMGRHAVELDGTRAFHRAEPWGGSQHNYNCYWGKQHLDHNLNMKADFWGEFGLACMPALESVRRYLPDDEQHAWPPPPDGSLIHHTPIFGTAEDWERLSQYAGDFTPLTDLPAFIRGSQLSQAVGLRHTLEHSRTRWPHCTGALYYKMNDNYPAASWATVDWYGAPKIGHSFVQDAFAPLHAAVVFNSVNVHNQPAAWPVFLLDDADSLQGPWNVVVRAYDASLQLVKQQIYPGHGPISAPHALGSFHLTAEQTASAPLLVVAEVQLANDEARAEAEAEPAAAVADRTFYFLNYENPAGSLFTLPPTTLALQADNGVARITNTGARPAVGVTLDRPGHLDTFTPADNVFWLDPGESRDIPVNATTGLTVSAWNADP